MLFHRIVHSGDHGVNSLRVPSLATVALWRDVECVSMEIQVILDAKGPPWRIWNVILT